MKALLLLVGFVLSASFVFSQKDKLEHVWYDENKTTKIQVFRGGDGLFYGKITWLLRPVDEKGKPRLDKLNPEPKLRLQTIINSVILKGFDRSASDTNLYENGTVYSPSNGKTYCGTILYKGKELKLRGYFCGFSILGKSWTCPLAE